VHREERGMLALDIDARRIAVLAHRFQYPFSCFLEEVHAIEARITHLSSILSLRGTVREGVGHARLAAAC
jgi:hypothetical protein